MDMSSIQYDQFHLVPFTDGNGLNQFDDFPNGSEFFPLIVLGDDGDDVRRLVAISVYLVVIVFFTSNTHWKLHTRVICNVSTISKYYFYHITNLPFSIFFDILCR